MRPGENEGDEEQWGSFLAQESIMDPLKEDAVLSFFCRNLYSVRYYQSY